MHKNIDCKRQTAVTRVIDKAHGPLFLYSQKLSNIFKDILFAIYFQLKWRHRGLTVTHIYIVH